MMLSAYLSPSRHGIYYFRWPLPRTEGHKRQTIRISLRTRCPNHAGDLARHLASCGRILRGNRDLAHFRQDEIREKVRAYFHAQLDQYLDWLDRRVLSKNALADARAEMLDHDCMVDLEAVNAQYLPIARFKRKMDVSDIEWDANLPRISIELRKGRRDMLRRVLEAAERLDHYPFSLEADSLPEPLLPSSAALGRAIDDFMGEHSRQWPEKTTKQIHAYLNILLEFFGPDRLLGSISKQDASEVKKVLQALPASRKTKPALNNLPLMEVIKVTGHKTIAPKTINSHIDAFKRFFDWAERHGHSPHKLFEGMKVPNAKDAETQRGPFTKEQTRLIYKELTANTSGLVRSESHKWGSLIGLFTGARLNEICQLDIADIQEQNGLCFLNITDEGDNKKRVNARSSRRKVPVHSELIRLGFLEFVKSRSGGQRLFPDYNYNPNGGYGRNLSRWFNETTFLPKLGLKKPGLVFHCLRHTIVTRLGQAGVAQPIIQCIVGHAREGVTQEVYFRDGYTQEQLKQAIEKFSV
jgi:integrase